MLYFLIWQKHKHDGKNLEYMLLLHRVDLEHDMTAACRRGKAEQVYIRSKSGHSILLDTVSCWTHYILDICLVLLFCKYSFQIYELSEYGHLLDPFSKLNSTIKFDGPLKIHKDDYFAKHYIKFGLIN